jgi:SAM-dependent methyltransferase
MSGVPFEEFARHYDLFMNRYVDYLDWVKYVGKVFRKFRAEPKRVLDVACGTGIPTVLMAGRGYEMVGGDRSAGMLAVLDDKKGTLPIETVRADIREFKLERPADAAICLYDSINYLLEYDDLVRCFTCVHEALEDGGLFTFDMNTLYGLSEFWGNRTTPRNVGNIASIWQNKYDPDTRISTLHLTFWEEPEAGGEAIRFEETHQERAYTLKEVKQALLEAGFGRLSFFSHGGFMPVGPLTTRMMVVAR